MTLTSLAGKHCAIVGATGVIGSAIAQTFAHQGAVLSLISRSALDNMARIEKSLKAPSASDNTDGSAVPRAHRFFSVDVADREAVRAAFYAKRGDVVGRAYIQVLVCCPLLAVLTSWDPELQ